MSDEDAPNNVEHPSDDEDLFGDAGSDTDKKKADDDEDLFGSGSDGEQKEDKEEGREGRKRRKSEGKKSKKSKKDKHSKKSKKEKKGKKEKRRRLHKGDQDDSSKEEEEEEQEKSTKDDDFHLQMKPSAEEEEEEVKEKEFGPPETLDFYSLPKFPPDTQQRWVRIPNFLRIEDKMFDPDTYEEEGILPPEAVIRWRYTRDESGNLKPESNARFVTWSDGSQQLLIGNEAYDMEQHDSHDFIYVRQNRFIKCHGQLSGNIIFKPSSLDSKSHRKLTNAIASRQKKERLVKIINTKQDPDKAKSAIEKEEEEKIRMNQKLGKMVMKNRERELPSDDEEGMSARYLEGSDED
ncbi:hypothetical protein PROFUN_00354 [Planoprotostelium fungivorum]|uniref:RNA polymerase-associated protein LEO1 n=1 Tax=Planoprotostelium fungivorum TaxID=1890364 RepID=A0A2P6NY55_9EUKA|nr:hypothetical protein PROFUN_00354 [Planoprotostelium fungivorum]